MFTQTFDQHLEKLKQVFDKLSNADLKLQPKKCHFGVKTVKYLGFQLDKNGIAVNDDKIKAVKTFPTPKTVHDIRAFNGLTNFYRRFIKGYSHISAPLYALLEKNATFIWSKQCEEAFTKLKSILTSAPVLTYPDWDKPFILHTDASRKAISYVVGQKDDKGKEQAICYGGRSLKKHERNYGVTDLELLALVEGIKYYHVYLATNKFKIITDHKALLSL